MRNKMKEIIKEIRCRYLGLHSNGQWENASRFIDIGMDVNFGWIARWRKTCGWCGSKTEKTPFLRSERKKMIAENNKARKKFY